MATVFDVAQYILKQKGTVTHMKLQKLCYYAQAWSLVWDDAPLFPNRIEAWANGPVIRDLYSALRGKFGVSSGDLKKGDPNALSHDERETVDAILKHYGDKSSQYLSDLTHMEEPWQQARLSLGVPPGERCEAEITNAQMAEYYSSI